MDVAIVFVDYSSLFVMVQISSEHLIWLRIKLMSYMFKFLLISKFPEIEYILFVLEEQFYKHNEAQICPKVKNELRTIETPGFGRKCSCKFLLKNTTHHVITCGASLQVFLLENTE